MAEPPNYKVLYDLLKAGQLIPLLGAGVNYGTRPQGAKYRQEGSEFLPDGRELSEFLAVEGGFPSEDGHERSDLAKVASFLVEESGGNRVLLRQYLRRVFHREYQTCEIHNYLAEISRTTPLLIVTTNYDDLMERALRQAECPFDLVVHPSDRDEMKGSVLWWRHGVDQPKAELPNNLHLDLKRTTVVYKMHGTVDRERQEWDSYLISEDDYVDFLAGMTRQRQGVVPAIFFEQFRKRQFLFMGYGLRDWNFRVVLRNLERSTPATSAGRPRSSWAIQYRPSDIECRLWRSRNVRISDIDINEFTRNIREIGT